MDINGKNLGEIVRTGDGSLTLRHPEHGECYHSETGAEAEAHFLYLVASGLEAGWARREPVSILDVGLGLGYNAVATITSWKAAANPPDLILQSLEIDPALVDAFASGFAPWQTTWETDQILTVQCLRRLDTDWRVTLHHPRGGAVCDWTISVGDAQAVTLAPGASGFDYVWQDPFSPQKNPEMWNAAWFARVLRHASPQVILMTYSVARAVRDGLSDAGWQPEKIPALNSTKRHWLRATKAMLIHSDRAVSDVLNELVDRELPLS